MARFIGLEDRPRRCESWLLDIATFPLDKQTVDAGNLGRSRQKMCKACISSTLMTTITQCPVVNGRIRFGD